MTLKSVCGIPVKPLTSEPDCEWLIGHHDYGCVEVKWTHIRAKERPGDQTLRVRQVFEARLELHSGREPYARVVFRYIDRRAKSTREGAVRGLEKTVKWALGKPWAAKR